MRRTIRLAAVLISSVCFLSLLISIGLASADGVISKAVSASVSEANLWAATYGNNGDDLLNAILQTNDGGYIAAGYKFSLSEGNAMWLIKFDPNGGIAWEKTYAGMASTNSSSIQQTNDGGYIVAGGRVLRLDENGTIIWQKEYVPTISITSIQGTVDGGYIVSGGFYDVTGYFITAFLKLDSGGGISWYKTFDIGLHTNPGLIHQTSDGGFIAIGDVISSLSDGSLDAWILKLDSNGDITWQKTFGYPSTGVNLFSIEQTTDGGYVATGWIGFPAYDAWLLKLNANGSTAWQKSYGSSGYVYGAWSVQQTNDAGYIVSGTISQFGSDFRGAWILKTDTDGNINWQKSYGTNSDWGLDSIQQTSDGGYIAVGAQNRSYVGTFSRDVDALVLKLDGNGDIPQCSLSGNADAVAASASVPLVNVSIAYQTGVATASNTTIVPQDSSSAVRSICEAVPTETPSPSEQFDVSISKTFIRPIQAVEGVNINGDYRTDLVLGKPMVVRVQPIIANSDLVLGNTQIDVTVSYKFLHLTKTTTVDTIQSDPNFFIDFFFTPFEVGDADIGVTVDTSVIEATKDNNSATYPVTVKETQSLHLVYLPIPFPDNLSHYIDTLSTGEEFLKATFPLAPSKVFSYRSDTPVQVIGPSILPNKAGFLDLYLKAYLIGKILDSNADRIVGVVPDSFSPYYQGQVSGGMSIGKGSQVVFVTEGYYTSEAHEIAHTYGLWNKPGPEEYELFQPGKPASGYWVEKGSPVIDSYCFMGKATDRYTVNNRWIDNVDYNLLFKELRKDKTDPEVLFVTGLVSPNGNVEFYKFYRSQEGIVDELNGDYSLILSDINGNLISTSQFSASFHVQDAEIDLDRAPFTLAVPFPEKVVTLQVVHNGVVIGTTDILTKLLNDAIDGIPASGVINNPEQRRNALHQKVNEVEDKIQAKDITDAVNKLNFDIKANLDRWLIDNYSLDNELQYSKPKLLGLVDELIARISAMK
jgi:hypothetical protein